MFTHCHVGCSICLLWISMGRDKLSPSIHNLNTSQALVKIQTVSGYVILTISSYLLYTQHLSRHSTNSELNRSRWDVFWYNWPSAGWLSASVPGRVQLKLKNCRFFLIIILRKHWTFLNSPPTPPTNDTQHVGFKVMLSFFLDNLRFCRIFPEFPSHNYFRRKF